MKETSLIESLNTDTDFRTFLSTQKMPAVSAKDEAVKVLESLEKFISPQEKENYSRIIEEIKPDLQQYIEKTIVARQGGSYPERPRINKEFEDLVGGKNSWNQSQKLYVLALASQATRLVFNPGMQRS